MSTTYSDLPNTNFPDSVDTFAQFINMTADDLTYVKQYQTAMENGDAATAQIAFNNISSGSQKIISPLRMNQLREAILAMERFYGTDIETYLEGKQTEWETKVDKFKYVGDFSPLTAYTRNNIVRYTLNNLNSLYMNIYDGVTPTGTYPNNTLYWQNITVQSEPSSAAPQSQFLYEWSSSTEYTLNNIVVYNNKWWIATQTSQNQAPAVGSAFWNKVLDITTVIYPIQATEPTTQVEGELWFKTLT